MELSSADRHSFVKMSQVFHLDRGARDGHLLITKFLVLLWRQLVSICRENIQWCRVFLGNALLEKSERIVLTLADGRLFESIVLFTCDVLLAWEFSIPFKAYSCRGIFVSSISDLIVFWMALEDCIFLTA